MKKEQIEYFCDICNKELDNNESIRQQEIIFKWYSSASEIEIGGGMTVGSSGMKIQHKHLKHLCEKCYSFLWYDDIGCGYFSNYIKHRDIIDKVDDYVIEFIEKLDKKEIKEIKKIRQNKELNYKDNFMYRLRMKYNIE